MSTIPTQNPVPSETAKDLKFNSGKIDEFVTSMKSKYIDRFGQEHFTIEGLRWIAQQAISQFGYITLDSFQKGAEITLPNQVLRNEVTGEYYRWDGALPKSVPVDSTPDSSGGVGIGKWLNVSDATLRGDLNKNDGAKLIGYEEISVFEKLKEIKSVIDYGVKGDGSDESLALQDVINSGVVNVPDGMSIHIKNVTIPNGTHINLNNTGAIVIDEYNALKFKQDKIIHVKPADKGSCTITLIDTALPESTKWIKIHRPFIQTDQWYIDNSENQNELGYTAEVFFIKSIDGNTITLSEPVGFELYNDSYITLIEGDRTTVTGGIIKSNVQNTPTGAAIFASDISNVDFVGVLFDLYDHAGIRFNASHSINFTRCVFKRSKLGNLNYSYGCTDCCVSYSISYGSLLHDGAITAFAGCRRVFSLYNKYYLEVSNLELGGFYVGAKCIGCKSIGDTFIGGKYGVMAMFGAQQFEFISPYCRGQQDAGVFVERCQHFKVMEPNVDLDHSSRSDSDPTFGSIVIKDCDNYLLHNSLSLCRNTKRMLSIYSFDFNKSKSRVGVNISLKGTGGVRLIVPTVDAIIDGVISNGAISYYQPGSITNRLIVTNCDVSTIALYNFINSTISNNKLRGSETGIQVLGHTAKWNYFINNSFHGASLCYELTESNKFMNSIKGVNLFGGSSRVCNFPIKSSDQVAVGYQSSNPAPKGFTLYVTEHLDNADINRSKLLFRHTGFNRGTFQDWKSLNISES
ncbi:hypothetical protein [Proteus hauseri]|uniref:tail fiber/spike domain-containing protein n=1 Tax=Proteus hauseri TaxID=183417 RepID=UPI0013E8FB4A|nr:hypothetical protein [Proteus hauseri]